MFQPSLAAVPSPSARTRREEVEGPDLPPASWAVRAGPLPADPRVHVVFQTWVKRTPDAWAVIEDGRKLTYRELNLRANRLAWFLRSRGVGPGVRVALCTERSIEMVVGQLGILKTGAAFVPVDASHPEDRIRFVLTDTDARFVVTQRTTRPGLPAVDGATIVCLDDDEAGIASQRTDDPVTEAPGDTPAYIIYTSGSTGRPKGSDIPHRGVVRLVVGQDYVSFRPGGRVLAMASPAFDGIIFEVWGPLLSGGTCVIFPDRWPEPVRLETTIRTQRVTSAFVTTSLFNQIIDVRPRTFATLREILVGGEALSVAHMRRALELLPGVALSNVYGPTECTAFAVAGRIPPAEQWTHASVPIGRPINHTEAHIVDATLRRVPVGEVGELLLGGVGLARGYLNRPELTAEKFIPHPWNEDPAARLYRTGDLCRWLPDGRIEYIGRADEQVKLRGFRIEPGEIEAAARERPEVANAAAVVRALADGRKQLVAFVVARGTPTAASEDEILRHLRTRLVEQMVPARVEFVDRLPLTSNGKVDRRALAERPLGGDRASPQPANAGSDEGSRVEAEVLAAWRMLLRNPALGADADFFREGGDSLLAVQVATELERRLAQPVPIGSVFACPTPRLLAAQLHRGSRPLRLRGSGPGAPLFVVPGIAGFGRVHEPLVERIRGRRPYCDSLQYPGMGDAGRPLDRIEDLAAALISQVAMVAPTGPVSLFGFSLGGIVAYEIAQQLRGAGREVEVVILGDSIAAEMLVGRGSWERRAMRSWEFLRPPWTQLRRKVAHVGRRVLPLRWRGEVVPPAGGATQVELAARRAYERYSPSTYAGRVALLRCEIAEFSPYYRASTVPDLGWSRWVTGPLSVHAVPCRHLDLFRGAASDRIADILAAI